MIKKILALCVCAIALLGARAEDAPKYVFLFIGDGQSLAQITLAQDYLGALENPNGAFPAQAQLAFTRFPHIGLMSNYDLTSFCPDSSSTASAMAGGRKVESHAVNWLPEAETPIRLLPERIRESATGRRVGIITTVTLNHATPAAFYARAASRADVYEIGRQGVRADSPLDFLAGGAFAQPNGAGGDQPSLYALARENGFALVNTNQAIRALGAQSGRTLAVVPGQDADGSLRYAIDAPWLEENGEDILDFCELVASGIRALDQPNGFFIMAEGGKIDWAQHANDAATGIRETIAFSDAVQTAVDFAALHPNETLIVVTGDHETGGLSIGWAGTAYDTHLNLLSAQKCSFATVNEYVARLRKGKMGFSRALALIYNAFGLTTEPGSALSLTQDDLARLKRAYNLSMTDPGARRLSAADALEYGACEPLTLEAIRILNHRAGVSYASFAHSGLPLPVYAMGARAELFAGAYDNTDLYAKLLEAMNLAAR